MNATSAAGSRSGTVPGALAAVPRRRAYRATDEALLGGVAAGLARHLGLPVLWVRIGFLAAATLGGFGAVTYVALWLVLREQPHFADTAPGLAAATRQGKRAGRMQRWAEYGPLVPVGVIALGVLVLLTMVTGRTFTLWPGLLALAGIAFLWRQADEAQRERWSDTGRITPLRALFGRGGWSTWARLLAGTFLLIAGITTFAGRTGDWDAALNVGLAAVLGIVGLAIIVGPWLLRLSHVLSEERAVRARSADRAVVAAHLHDSVLQTLAMIQKSAADPATVTRLARAQERDLRTWLYEAPATGETTVAAALRAAAAEVEDGTGVPVEVVCVGDRSLPDAAQPLVLAAREAMLNAAKHSGAAQVDVYAEAGARSTDVFVRDRGRGFDPAAVPADRHGVRNSIVDRMERHGGSAEVRSSPDGGGTEVRLSLPVEDA
jgi:signal transduction histidine kinase/phage shock protein PspC (stress-responsive transcriptional regulator)